MSITAHKPPDGVLLTRYDPGYRSTTEVESPARISPSWLLFAADALGPHCESVTLSFYSEARPDKADVLTVDRPIVERIWQDFAPYRAEGKQDAAQ